MEKASSTLRRLRHLFLQKPTSTTAVAASTTVGKFENLVNQFKKNSTSRAFRGNRNVYKVAVHRLANAGHFSYIHDILDHQKQYPEIKDEHFIVRLICLYGEVKMLDHALKLFDEMPNLSCPRTVLSFNGLMSACISSENFNKAIELFQELPGKISVQPDVISFNLAIKAFCKMGLLDRAVSMVDEMEKNDVNPSVITFYTLFDAFWESGRFSEGETLWNLMKEKKVTPDLRCYNYRMNGMVNEKRVSEALEMLKKVEDKGLKPNSYTYNVLIKGSLSEGNVGEAKKWYAKMLESDFEPDFFTFMTIIIFGCNDNDIDFALELCRKALDLNKKISTQTMQKVINKLVEQSKIDEAKELLELVNSTKGWEHAKLSLPAETTTC